MNQRITVPNPWTDRGPFVGYLAREKWGAFRFLNQPSSVVAILGDKAVTQCVTVRGAIRELQRRGYNEAGERTES